MLWLDMFHHSHIRYSDFYMLRDWPNGKPYIDQSNIVVMILDVIKDEVNSAIKQKLKQEARKHGK